ncbi:TfoX/Sxy family protein [Reichenbachiella agarivorans]|uniref:TfoX/Sxy family protein n=1 Tax=Reichenbachiella agarivorans TaxID=2979464 RepID=A0ABY6CSC2_9BACT|nr:TfoX/Sxy family protein [Reichenbachiella agarivorans]UXP33391.1 TfoX/Sxy family protein [Reichenbachiella agarivorans]
MAYNEETAARIRQHLQAYGDAITEKKMFGGLCFLYHGKMSVGIVKEELCVRVLAPKDQQELHKAHVRPMDFTGKPMKEMIFVEPAGFQSEAALGYYILLGIEHAESKLG